MTEFMEVGDTVIKIHAVWYMFIGAFVGSYIARGFRK